jgi:hypothetical protein
MDKRRLVVSALAAAAAVTDNGVVSARNKEEIVKVSNRQNKPHSYQRPKKG